MPFRLSLRSQIIIAFTMIAIVMGVGMGATVQYFAGAGLEEEVGAKLATVTAGARSRIDLTLTNLYQQLRATALRETAAGERERVQRLEFLQFIRPEFEWIGVVDPNGLVTHSTDAESSGRDVSGQPWFRRAIRSARLETVFRNDAPVEAPGADTPAPFAIAVAIQDPAGAVKGVLVARISLDLVRGTLKGSRQTHFRTRGLELLVADENGIVLAGTQPQPLRRVAQPGLTAAQEGRESLGWESWADGRYLTAYSGTRGVGDYGGPGWVLIARQDEMSATAPVVRLNTYLLLVAVAIAILGFVPAVMLAEWLSKPVRTLTATADSIRSGNRDIIFSEVKSSLEMERLSAALREMMIALASKEQALSATNIELERQVQERTAALVEASAAVERERERLAYALEGSRIVSWDADVSNGTVWLDTEWARMIGAPEGETVARFEDLVNRIPEEERARVSGILWRVIKGHLRQYDVEHGVRRDDGSIFWIHSRGKVTLRDADGRAVRMTGTNSDITRRRMAEEELRESEAKLRLVTDNLPVMINYLDRNGRFLFVNKPYLDFLGVSGQNIVGKRLRDVAGQQAEDLALSHMAELEAGKHVTYGRQRADSKGRQRTFEIRQVPLFGSQGKLQGFFSLIDDVTEREEAKLALMASEAQLRELTDNLPSVICEMDLNGKLIYANRGYHAFYGIPDGRAVGKRINDLAGPEAQAVFDLHVDELREGKQLIYEREVTIKGRGAVQIEVHLVPHKGTRGNVTVYAMIIDVTTRKQVEQLLQQQALTDNLTGLPNRRLLRDRMDSAIARAGREEMGLGVLYLDLDGFKPVNDTLGHAAGDELLKQVAARLSSCVRDSDTVARVGGDEFVLLLESCASLRDAENAADKIIRSLDAPFALAARSVTVSCSVGISLFPLDGNDADTLLRAADAGLYAAKRGGKHCHVHRSA